MIDAVIIGGGFSGICAAIKLKQAGFEFLLLEKAMTIGGTWRDNTYPGCACDIPAALYSFSFAPGRNWTRIYPQQSEIQTYLERVFRDFELSPHTRFNIDVIECQFESAQNAWLISARTAHGMHRFEARHVIMATGPLNKPALPDLPGKDFFHGTQFHSMHWRHDIDLTGRRVCVIGTGASAVQFVPEIARIAASVTVFQRTPPWVVPRRDRPIGFFRAALRAVPVFRKIERAAIFWRHEMVAMAYLGNAAVLSAIKAIASRNMRKTFVDRAARVSITPSYDPGCKRVLLSDDWYPTLARSNVRVVSGAPKMIERNAVLTHENESIKTDVLIYATGFKAHDFVRPMKVVGRDGAELGGLWHNASAASYYGLCVNGFPNLFMLVGPNTALGHNSIVFMIEAQVGWVVNALTQARSEGRTTVEVTRSAQERVYANIQKKIAGTVWVTGGCNSYYKTDDGRVDTIWPDYSWKYWLKIRRFDVRDFAPPKAPT
jgi:cation diffusion facilitator CzcD-associated flavoprotein CzcO